jgi:integrase
MNDHLIPAFGSMALDSIGPAEIEDFKAAMRKKPSGARARKEGPQQTALRRRKGSGVKLLSLKSINNVLAVLHKLLALAQEQGVLEHVPRVKLFKTDKPAFDFLSFEDAECLINAAEMEWRTLILLALKTGLRHGELIGLQWADLDLQRGKLQVRRSIWQGVTGLPKGGRERTVGLPCSAVDALKGHRHLRGLCHLAMHGVALKVIQELMGHATIEMTMRYAHLSPEARESAVQELDRAISMTARRAGLETPAGHTGAHDEPGTKEKPSNPLRLVGFSVCPRRDSNPSGTSLELVAPLPAMG